MRFFEVDSEVTVKRFGERGGLVGTFGKHLFSDHRIVDIFDDVAVLAEKFEIEFGVVKDLYDLLIFEYLGQSTDRDSLADRQKDIELAVGKLDREKLAVTRVQPRCFRIAAENFGRREPFESMIDIGLSARDQDIHGLIVNRLNKGREMYYPDSVFANFAFPIESFAVTFFPNREVGDADDAKDI